MLRRTMSGGGWAYEVGTAEKAALAPPPACGMGPRKSFMASCPAPTNLSNILRAANTKRDLIGAPKSPRKEVIATRTRAAAYQGALLIKVPSNLVRYFCSCSGAKFVREYYCFASRAFVLP